MTHTRTFSILEVSKAAYDEIRTKMLAAGYDDAVWDQGEHGTILDMDGIALGMERAETSDGTGAETVR